MPIIVIPAIFLRSIGRYQPMVQWATQSYTPGPQLNDWKLQLVIGLLAQGQACQALYIPREQPKLNMQNCDPKEENF